MTEGLMAEDLVKLCDEDRAIYRYCHSDNLFYTYPEGDEEYSCYEDDFELSEYLE